MRAGLRGASRADRNARANRREGHDKTILRDALWIKMRAQNEERKLSYESWVVLSDVLVKVIFAFETRGIATPCTVKRERISRARYTRRA